MSAFSFEAVMLAAFFGSVVGGLIAYTVGYRDGRTETRLKQAKPMIRRVK